MVENRICEPGVPIPIIAPGGMSPEAAWLAYSSKQRQWWLRVYGGRCHFPVDNARGGLGVCGSASKIEIHHITPSAWIVEQMPDRDPNSLCIPEGLLGIALCKLHHDHDIHPDMGDAIHNYYQDKGGIKRAVDLHHQMAKEGRVFWNDEWDEVLKLIARNAVEAYQQNNPTDLYPKDSAWERKGPHPKKNWWDLVL